LEQQGFEREQASVIDDMRSNYQQSHARAGPALAIGIVIRVFRKVLDACRTSVPDIRGHPVRNILIVMGQMRARLETMRRAVVFFSPEVCMASPGFLNELAMRPFADS